MNRRLLGGRMILLFTFFALVLCSGGCALFHRDKSDPEKEIAEAAFESERSEESKMSEFAASAGRKNPKEKKSVSKGETFLLSSKAKEIYANTER